MLGTLASSELRLPAAGEKCRCLVLAKYSGAQPLLLGGGWAAGLYHTG